jgi:hypothetical protein
LCVNIEGEPAMGTLYGYNLINGIYFEGLGIGPITAALPISGSFTVIDSRFQYMGSAVPVANVSHASIIISRNDCQDVYDAMDVAGLLDARYVFSFNTVERASYGGYAYDLPITVPHINSSEMLVSHNVFSGDQYGVYLDATFEGGARCQVVSNDFQNIASTGIYLGPGTSHCIVAGNSNTAIQNLGTDNVIVNKGSAP